MKNKIFIVLVIILFIVICFLSTSFSKTKEIIIPKDKSTTNNFVEEDVVGRVEFNYKVYGDAEEVDGEVIASLVSDNTTIIYITPKNKKYEYYVKEIKIANDKTKEDFTSYGIINDREGALGMYDEINSLVSSSFVNSPSSYSVKYYYKNKKLSSYSSLVDKLF